MCHREGMRIQDPPNLFEIRRLSLLRQRSLEAIRQKARRRELRFRLPISVSSEAKPARSRLQQAVHLVFAKMTEPGGVCVRSGWGFVARESACLPRVKDPDKIQ